MTKLCKYLVFTFTASWLIMLIGLSDRHQGGFGAAVSMGMSMMLSMLMPALGAFIAGGNFRDMGWNPEIQTNKRLILLAWLSPTVLELAGSVLYYLIFPSDFDLSGNILRYFDSSAYSELLESGGSYVGYILKEILFSMISPRLCYGLFLALGEEIGWRGFLFPELDSRFGRTKGALIGGIIHGIWHFPLIIFAGFEYGDAYLGAPVMGPLVFCAFTISTGIISYYLYRKSFSIWLPALFHAAFNAAFNPSLMRGTEHQERTIFGPASVGMISVIPTAVFAFYLIYREYKQENDEFASF